MGQLTQSIPYTEYTTVQRDLLSDVVKDEIIYNTTNVRYEIYDGTIWQKYLHNSTDIDITSTIDPTTSDDGYEIGQKWINTVTDTVFVLVDNTASNAVWKQISNTPGGADTNVQFNDDGVFGGQSTFIFDKTTNLLSLNGTFANNIPVTYIPAGTTQTINWQLGNLQILDLGSTTGNVTLTYSNPVAGATYYLKVIQGATTRTLVYPATVKWNGATALIPTTTNDAIDLITMFYDGTNYLSSYTTNYA